VSGDGDVVESAQAGRSGLAGSRLQHRQPAPEVLGANDRGTAEDDRIASPGRQHRHQVFGEDEWKMKNHGADYRRRWRKVHLGIDSTTLEIQAIEVTCAAPMLPCLLNQIADDKAIASVGSNGACDTKACHKAIAHRSAQAIIPTRRNAMPCHGKCCVPGAARNAILDARRRCSRKIWEECTGYH